MGWLLKQNFYCSKRPESLIPPCLVWPLQLETLDGSCVGGPRAALPQIFAAFCGLPGVSGQLLEAAGRDHKSTTATIRVWPFVWCCYEMAVFVRSSQTKTKAMHFVPTWAPIWIFAFYGVACFALLGWFVSATAPSELGLVTSSRRELFWSSLVHQMSGAPVLLTMAVPFSWFCLKKVRRHRHMLQQWGTST